MRENYTKGWRKRKVRWENYQRITTLFAEVPQLVHISFLYNELVRRAMCSPKV
jgi:hypothetical protein